MNDLHGPFHDPKTVALVLDIIEDAEVTEIIINGDMLDFYSINFHGPKHPHVGTMLEDEISWGRVFLKDLRNRFPNTKITFLFGNHEHRLERFIVQNCNALFNYVSLEKLLELNELKIQWFPYNTRYQLSKSNVFVQHSPPSYGKNGAMTSLEKDVDESSIYGCSHRELKATRTGKSGKVYYCYYNGWLGSTTLTKEHEQVFGYIKGHESWQQCFSIATVVDKKNAFVEQISIQNHRAYYEGYLYG